MASHLIALVGREQPLGGKLYERLNMEGRVLLYFGNYDSNIKAQNNLVWNRGSSISAKTAVREMRRLLGVPNEIFVFFGQKYDEISLNFSIKILEEIIDNELKSLLYITHELYKLALDEGSETAIYFIAHRPYDAKRPLSSAAALGFKGYVEGLMQNSKGIYMAGFELSNEDEEGFLNFVLKTTTTQSGKKQASWNIYPKINRLFGA
jgi:hypothetical protein